MSFRHSVFALACAAALVFGSFGDAFARAGGGSSFGSRGSRTYSAPSSTNTAPGGAAPMQRSMTPSQNAARPQAAPSPAGGMFSGGFGRGLMGGLVGGFLGAGLFGLLAGHGLFGGFSGISSILGLLLQVGIIFLIVKLVMGFIRSRQQPAMQGSAYSPLSGQGGSVPPTGTGFMGLGGGGGAAANAPPRSAPLDVQPADFDTFERRLGEVQTAYGNEDLDTIRRVATPEMASYFAEEVASNTRQGKINKVSGAKLLKGDLAEAWSEGSEDFATVAMHFSVVDTMVDRASGRIVSGNPSMPEEATEIWTFERRRGGGTTDWKLSAIQQAA